MIKTTATYRKYDLPDYDLVTNNLSGRSFFVWHPDKTYIVLGQSNKTESSVNTEMAMADGVDILKRPSGGEAVILTPKTIVIAFISRQYEFKKPLDFFRNSNRKIIHALESWPGINGIHQRGISDLSVNNVKIAGSAIYRSREQLFYHMVLNVHEDISMIDRYLLHPGREPDYRKGRRHSEFVTNLHQLGYPVSPVELKLHFESIFQETSQTISV
ncbi:MAG: biotin/lipoate A/B protein ligase family protein [Bacteroidales bacterium]